MCRLQSRTKSGKSYSDSFIIVFLAQNHSAGSFCLCQKYLERSRWSSSLLGKWPIPISYPYLSALDFWHSIVELDIFPCLKYLVWNSVSVVHFKLDIIRIAVIDIKLKLQKNQVHQNLILFQVWNKLDLEKLKVQVQMDRVIALLLCMYFSSFFL